MYSFKLDNITNTIELTVSSSPKLSITADNEGKYHGYITSIQDIKRLYVAEDYAEIQKMNAMTSLSKRKPLADDAKNGDFAVVKLLDTYARAIIEDVNSANRTAIRLLDTGDALRVDKKNLFDMHEHLRAIRPLAFPIDVDHKEIYPEAITRQLNHLIGHKITFNLDYNATQSTTTTTTLQTNNLMVFNQYMTNYIPYFTSIMYKQLFNNNYNKTTIFSNTIRETMIVERNFIATQSTSSSKIHNISMIVPFIVMLMIFGSIALIVGKLISDRRRAASQAATTIIRVNDEYDQHQQQQQQQQQQQHTIIKNERKKPIDPLSSNISFMKTLSSVSECTTQPTTDSSTTNSISSKNLRHTATTQRASLLASQPNMMSLTSTSRGSTSNELSRLEGGISMISSIAPESYDQIRYYSSSSDITFSNPQRRIDRKKRSTPKSFPKRSTPIHNQTINSELSETEDIADKHTSSIYAVEDVTQESISIRRKSALGCTIKIPYLVEEASSSNDLNNRLGSKEMNDNDESYYSIRST